MLKDLYFYLCWTRSRGTLRVIFTLVIAVFMGAQLCAAGAVAIDNDENNTINTTAPNLAEPESANENAVQSKQGVEVQQQSGDKPPVKTEGQSSIDTPIQTNPTEAPNVHSGAASGTLPVTSGGTPKSAPTSALPSKSASMPSSAYDPLAQYLVSKGPKSGYEIIINLPAFRLYLYHNGLLTHSYPIAVGKIVSPSNLGTTRIINKVVNPTWYPPDWAKKGLKPVPPGPDNPVGTRWLGLAWKGYGIHGTNDPSSIGSALSGGCIRMHNRDVEALAQLVSINTPVTFVYDLVAINRQPAEWPMIQVYKDIYKLGYPKTSSVNDKVLQMGIQQGINEDALSRIILEANGKMHPLPTDHPVQVHGLGIIRGYQVDSSVYVSLNGLVKLLAEENALQMTKTVSLYGQSLENAWSSGSVTYAPLSASANALGLLHYTDDSLRVAKVSVANAELKERLFVLDGQPLLPIDPMAKALGVGVHWDNSKKALIINGMSFTPKRIISGKAYLTTEDAAKALGVHIAWDGSLGLATVISPQIVLDNLKYEGFWLNEELWLPVRMLAEASGVALTWDQVRQVAQINAQEVQGILRGGRLYVAQSVLLSLFPEITATWDEPTYTLTLMLTANPSSSDGL